MDMSGEYRIAAPRETVWQALNDPEILRQCIPGCEEIEKVSDTEFTAKAKVKVGPVSAKFAGRVQLSDLDPPNGYTITGEGQGGAAGFGKGGAKVALLEDGPDATLLSYTAEAQVGGKLAQVGSRLVQGTAKKMADDFFAKFTQIVGGDVSPAETAPAASAPVAPGVETGPDRTDPMLHTTDEAADGMTVPPAPRPEPSVAPPASPAAAVPGDVVTPPKAAGNVPPGEPTRMANPPSQRTGIGPAVWIPVLVIVLALVLWLIL